VHDYDQKRSEWKYFTGFILTELHRNISSHINHWSFAFCVLSGGSGVSV